VAHKAWGRQGQAPWVDPEQRVGHIVTVVLPVLHLNGSKIANPTILARIPHAELEHLFRAYGHEPCFVEGSRRDTGILRVLDQYTGAPASKAWNGPLDA